MELSVIQKIIVFALPVIFAITLHEAAHGYAAKYFGDLTAYQAGRISLNPLRHIDPVGTLLVPGIILLTSSLLGGGFILFGWAKPVPVNFGRLRRPKQDMFWVALAGPAANLAMALFWAAAIRFAATIPGSFSEPLFLMGVAGVFINSVLIALNLLPLPPLDGGRIAVSLLPQAYAYRFSKIEPYGMIILILLMFTHVLGVIMWPLMELTISGVVSLLGIRFDQYMNFLFTLLK
jgi:Zn-dependent protease